MTYFIVCQNPRCGAVKPVRSPYEQRTVKYCSHSCTSTMTKNLTHAAQRAGGLQSKKVRAARALARIQGMRPLEIWRAAYSQGWKAGARSARRRMHTRHNSEAA